MDILPQIYGFGNPKISVATAFVMWYYGFTNSLGEEAYST